MTAERASFHMHRDLGIEHISATYRQHRFPPHAHQEYLIGLTIAGVEHIIQDGERWQSRAGQVRTINPGVVHEGGCGEGEPWAYEALYIPETLILEAVLSVGRVTTAPRLSDPVLDDHKLAGELRLLFALLKAEDEALIREEALTGFLSRVARHRILRVDRPLNGREPQAVARARDYLAANARRRVPLEILATVSGLSKFHLLRVFKAQTGLTPWQFQTQIRIDLARRLLAAGEPAGQVAAACGYADQSHMTRRFRELVGLTPAAYAADTRRSFLPSRSNILQDRRSALDGETR
ncbi:helix-turn-helix domain-containing protein [Novosphingobium sp. FGD1]|jgi:AraC-like DNA-binding protein|uniref:Helix-turn-helix domain-containing protein n=1 Tax=Novosphingobium silvae TaxID=2692619 RepID=A0A7X4K881_9SPHN|nr:AraC family transcriptional regulator [Novosphingobium silvae]MYL99876.1 helix-turn-helix domain-containing protein [Novosphingobium silvae]